MLCNNAQFYEWHPVYPMRGWTFAWRVGPKGYTVTGGEFHPGAKWTKKQMRRKKKEARKVARQQKLTVERIPDHRPVTNLKFKHARFPYQHRETSPRCRVHSYRVKKEDVPAMIAAGYRRTSRKFLGLCRIDRPDWREYMAFQHAPWDPAGEGMNWVNGIGGADHYRRCYSEDRIQLADSEIFMMFPPSRDGEKDDDYVEATHFVAGAAYKD